MRTPSFTQPLEPRRLLSLTPLGGEVVVPTAGPADHFASAMAGDGSFIVVAETNDSTNHRQLVAHRYSAGGAHLDAVVVDDTGLSHVSAAMDDDGDGVIVFGGSRDVFAVLLSRTGTASAPVHVGSAPAGGLITDTAVSMDRGGGFFVGWIDALPESFSERIQVRAFDAAGAPRGPQFSNGSNSGLGSFNNLEVAATPDGSGAAYAYESFYSWPPYTYNGRVSPSAFGPTAPFHDGGEPSIAMYADGSSAIAYARWRGASLGAAQPHAAGYVQRYDASGARLGGTLVLGASLPDDGESRHIESVAIDATSDGGFVAAYRQRLDDVDTTYVERFSAAGVSTGAPLAIETDPTRDHEVGAARDGTIVVAYAQPQKDSFFSAAPVHVRRLRDDAPAVAPGPETGDVFVNGTGAGERISVSVAGDEVVVDVGGTITRYPRAAVNYLSINGFGGDDDIDNNTDLPSTIHGGDGFDTIWGGTGKDRIRGQGGNDYLRGGHGDDTILGENGGDSLHGGDGNDVLLGHAGEDTLDGAAGADAMHGHLGTDTVDYSKRANGLFASLDEFQDDGEAGEADFAAPDLDVLLGGRGADRLSTAVASVVRGGDGNDTLVGQLASDSLYGEGGNDHLEGGSGKDYLEGGAGHDLLIGGLSKDTLFGLGGNDRLLTDDGGVWADVVRGGPGTDTGDVDNSDDVLGVETVS